MTTATATIATPRYTTTDLLRWIDTNSYYVGDLCYTMKEDWEEICEIYDDRHVTDIYELFDGRIFKMVSTGGDGTFSGSNGVNYSVDSGTIGVIKVSDIPPGNWNDLLETVNAGIASVELLMGADANEVAYFENGRLNFGITDINLGNYWLEDDDEGIDIEAEDAE